MLDLSLALKELKQTQEVHILSVNNECKELLILLGQTSPAEISIHCVNLFTKGTQKEQHFVFTREQEQCSECTYTDSLETYLYEPNASLLKAGAFRSIAAAYPVRKLHPNSHLYTSDTFIENFPGRIFRIVNQCSFNKKEVKENLADLKKANVTVRNFPATVALIKAILLLIAFTLSCHTLLFSQRDFERHEFSFHAGYGVMFHHPPTLTLSTHSYQRTLAQGVSWDGQYNFRPLKRFVFGGIYSGFSSKGSHPEGKDHLWVHFIGTQIGMCNANTKHWQIRVTTGPGGVILRNNSEVFGKTRKVKAFTIGLLTNANLTYKLNPNLGVSLGVQYMYSELLRIRTHYHGERVIVKLDGNNDTNLTRINFTTGLSYYF